MADSAVSSISGATLEKARRELFEEPATRLESIAQLRERVEQWRPSGTEEGLDLLEQGRKDDRFLLRFLRAKKFDVERSLQLYVNYHKFRKKHSHLIVGVTPQSMEHVLKTPIARIMPARKKDGSLVMCVFPGLWDWNKVPFIDVFKGMLLVMDHLIEDEEVQVHGVSLFVDMENTSFMSVLKLTQSEAFYKGLMIEIMQETFPARVKGLHLINQPWYVSMLLAIVRPFMKQKLRDRLITHGADLSSLHEYIDPEQLPAEFGGLQPSMDPLGIYRMFEEEISSTQD